MRSESTTGQSANALRLIIAGGGTGGHVSPAVAVAQELQRRRSTEILWIGSGAAVERDAAAAIGATFATVKTGKLRRYLSLQTPLDAMRIPVGVVQAWRLLAKWRDAVVVSTGGFVSVPTVVAARMRGIPTLTHEQTAHIGLATKINARFADVVALSYERSQSLLSSARGRVVVTGNPVRASVLHGDAARAYSAFDLPDDLPLVYITGGAQGARSLNAVVADSLSDLLGYVAILHQAGPLALHNDAATLQQRANTLSLDLRSRYRVVELVGDEIGDVYAAASVVLGRAGAGTVNEVSALGIPAILVPLPGAEEQHQNAQQLVQRGAAIEIFQADLTPERLVNEIRELVTTPGRLTKMRAAACGSDTHDAASRLADEVESLAQAGRD
ncbi:MAG: undecaprenyldiphospho-muramoylpentapeptide beta-N-acetylglucosaminyltransferase [Thermomicrobiales bacterium]|nr:undecaprenyldiphospho-muramoylpentapeptide beta-N-acetylglucosaminyltransferase [Thermomicrobiales bacterium]